jgi:hypothetical protein
MEVLFLLNTEKVMGWKRHKQFPEWHQVISIKQRRIRTGWVGSASTC